MSDTKTIKAKAIKNDDKNVIAYSVDDSKLEDATFVECGDFLVEARGFLMSGRLRDGKREFPAGLVARFDRTPAPKTEKVYKEQKIKGTKQKVLDQDATKEKAEKKNNKK